MKMRLSAAELLQAYYYSEDRRLDRTLPIDVRVRSAETAALVLREAAERGLDLVGLTVAAERGDA